MATVIVGVDLSLSNTGIVTIMRRDDGGLIAVAATLIKTAKASKKENLYAAVDDIQRAAHLYQGIMEELRASRPVLVAVELPSGSQSAVASKAGGVAKGVIAGVREAMPEIPFLWLHENQIKQALVGRHKASKQEIAQAVLARIPDLDEHLREFPKTKREHITDAAATVLASEGSEMWRARMCAEAR